MSQPNPFPEKTARELGLDLVTPGPYDVFLDIDSKEDLTFMEGMLKLLSKNNVGFIVMKTTESKSGNEHVYLRFDRAISPIERIALQACLGSDRKRELWSLLNLWTHPTCHATVFFEKPGLFDLNKSLALVAPQD